MKPTIVNITDLRDNLADYLDLVRFEKRSLDISRRGKIIAQINPRKQLKKNYAKAVRKAANTFSDRNHPEWENIDKIIKWVNKERKIAERY